MQDAAGTPPEPSKNEPEADPSVAKASNALQRARSRLANLGLPAKLLVITIIFVMLAEVLVFVPSIAQFRLNWLEDRIAAARLAALVAETSPGGDVKAMVKNAVLSTAEVEAVAVKKHDTRLLVLPSDKQLVVDATFDLRRSRDQGVFGWLRQRIGLIGDALYVFIAPSNRMLAVYGRLKENDVPENQGDFIEVVVPENPLRAEMMQHGLNVLLLSIIISIIAAAAVYFTLIQVLVRPMMRLTDNMVYFGENPEDPSRIIEPAQRSDETGVAEQELAKMQRQLNQLLQQRKRLADLGLAVSKINHDLRNMLSSAQLISDRLGELPDPTVQRFAPKLIASLDRAINFCNDTLRFGRAEEAAPRRELFNLADLAEEVADGLGLPQENIDWQCDIAASLKVDADRDHLYRVLNNLARNSVQAIESTGKPGEGTISVSASRTGRRTIIELSDDGPGVPPRAQENLFKAFKGGTRKGGTGLGLAISAELIRAHGGEISLLESDTGAKFRIEIPDRSVGPASS